MRPSIAPPAAAWFAAACCLCAFGALAKADSLGLVGHGTWGDCTGTLSYAYDGARAMGDLWISLTNTSNPANGGYLTGFVFNINGDATARLNPNPTDLDGSDDVWTDQFWDATLLDGSEKASPFDPFSFGAALAKKSVDPTTGQVLDGVFLGAGNPTRGIAVGKTAKFHFDVEGSDAPTLKAMSFMSKASSGPAGTSSVFLARFMGFNNQASNKTDVTTVPVPIPSAMWASAGMLGLLATIRVVGRRGRLV